MRSLPLGMGLLALSLSSTALAGTFPEDVGAAGDALKGADAKAALSLLDTAEDTAEDLSEVVNSKSLAQYWFYRGVASWMKGGSIDDGGQAWRNALIVDNDYEWDEEIAKDRDAQDFFLALRAEVRSRPLVNPAVPEATGEARIYVDGIRVRAGDLAREGTHLAQIRCPDLATFGEWSTFAKAPKYFKKCPGGVDTSIIVEEAEEDEDDFGDIGPAFGGGGEDAEEPAGPPPDPTQDVADTIARGAGIVAPEEAEDATGGDVEVIRKKVIWPAFGAGVAAAGAAAAMQIVALNQNRAYNDVENSEYESADELADLRKKTNRNQTLVYPLLAVSGGLLFTATYQW
jgi:hypothetical protein